MRRPEAHGCTRPKRRRRRRDTGAAARTTSSTSELRLTGATAAAGAGFWARIGRRDNRDRRRKVRPKRRAPLVAAVPRVVVKHARTPSPPAGSRPP